MKKIRIFVCCHKPYDGYSDEVYTPLHVGRAISTCTDEMKNMIGDDTGDNISEKNPYYSEATGIYWIWKNVHVVEYVGLIHYRRDFAIRFTEDNIDNFFKDGTEVIMMKNYKLLHRWYTAFMYSQIEDLAILKGAIEKVCPDYMRTFDMFMNDYYDYPYNMVICKKELYDKYAKWMFDICFEMEKYVIPSGYSNSRRCFGYIAELLTPIYFLHNNHKIKNVKILREGVVAKTSFIIRFCAFILHNTVYRFEKGKPYSIPDSVYRGLKSDGIVFPFKH